MRWVTFMLIVLLTGCSTIDYDRKPPVDWPQMAVSVYVGMANTACGVFDLACTWIDDAFTQCHIYLPAGYQDWMLKHEQAHCDGYDHHGESTLRDAWESWKTPK